MWSVGWRLPSLANCFSWSSENGPELTPFRLICHSADAFSTGTTGGGRGTTAARGCGRYAIPQGRQAKWQRPARPQVSGALWRHSVRRGTVAASAARSGLVFGRRVLGGRLVLGRVVLGRRVLRRRVLGQIL